MQVGGSCLCTSCVRPKCKCFLCSSSPSRLTAENSSCWAVSWPRCCPGSQGGSHSPLTDSFHHVPTRWEGSWSLGRGSCSHLPYSHSVVFSIFRYTCPSPQSTLEYFHYFKKGPLPFSYHSPIRHLPFPSTEQTTNLLLVSIDFPIFGS